MKRAAPELPWLDADAKKLKPDAETIFEKVRSVQADLAKVDAECLKEQVKIQREFAKKMQPLLEKRDDILKGIEQFWGRLILTFPLGRRQSFSKEDKELLPHLESIHVEDNLDENGSYKLTFKFNEEKTKGYFKPAILVRQTRFVDEPGSDEDDGFQTLKIESTPVEWVGEPLPKILDDRFAKENEEATKKKEAGEKVPSPKRDFSFFEWFSGEDDNLALGEYIRRELYRDPISVALREMSSDDEDDDEDDSDLDGQGGSDEDDE